MRRIQLGVLCLVAALAVTSLGVMSTPVHASNQNVCSHTRNNYVTGAAAAAAGYAKSHPTAASKARARALAAKACLKAPTLTTTGNKSTAPASTTVPSAGTSNVVASAGGAPQVASLPSTGGAVPDSFNGSLLLSLLALIIAGVGSSLRRFAGRV